MTEEEKMDHEALIDHIIQQDVLHLEEQEPERPKFTFKGREIQSGKKFNPVKMIIYGDNGVGKSHLASGARNVVFADLEGNNDHLEVDRERLDSAPLVGEFLTAILENSHDYKNLVIDSLDTLYSLVVEEINKTNNSKELSYGRDSKICQNEFTSICKQLDAIRTHRRMNIILLAHTKIKQFNNPLTGSYDRWETTLNDNVFRLLIDWSNCVFFAVKDVGVKEDRHSKQDKQMAYNAPDRWLYTEGDAAYFAKNIYQLPEKIKMDVDPKVTWSVLTKHIKEFFEK